MREKGNILGMNNRAEFIKRTWYYYYYYYWRRLEPVIRIYVNSYIIPRRSYITFGYYQVHIT